MMHAQRRILLTAAIIGFLCVALGAFAAHALKEHLIGAGQHQYELGVRYAFFHVLALMMTALARPVASHPARIDQAARFFVIGIVLFSGSLILLGLTGIKYFAFVTPLGGLSFLVAWVLLIFSMRAHQT